MTTQQLEALLDHLMQAQKAQRLLTYRELVEQLSIAPPAIARLSRALEQLQAYDFKQQQPMRSALVVSQRLPAIPRLGFFECYSALTGLSIHEQDREQWHADYIKAVYQFSY
ncbi:hypothetical protein VQ643_10570 [Pseudomonas sp. F1_0610]|uniref:hypothetical protein n=1 Tax=Pseudomonas sp. F1_0610 TaxID=3114284 RepID=UPI0039C37DD3